MALRAWLSQLALFVFASLALSAGAVAEEFGAAFVPTFKFSEHYSQSVVYDEEFEEYTTSTAARLSGTLRLSTQGVKINTFQTDPKAVLEDVILEFEVGNLDLELAIADGEQSTDTAGRHVVTWILSGTNPDTFDIIEEAGTVTLRYSAEELTVTFSVEDVPDDYNIIAPDEAGNDEVLDDVQQFLTFTLGDYELSNSTAYVSGTARLYDKTVGQGDNEEEFTDLPIVNLDGEFDIIRPTVTISSPTNHSTVNTDTIHVSGVAEDKHGVAQVLLQVNDGPFEPTVLGADGRWSLENVLLRKGRNVLVAKAIDFSANERPSASRTVTYSLMSDLRVTATGTGSGTVTASFFEPVQYVPGQAAPVRIAEREILTSVTLTAKPGPNSVFDGWESNQPLTPDQVVSPRLTFVMAPNAEVTARFLENPFGPVKGKYSGLIQSAVPAARGILMAKLSSRGGFTLVAKIGKLTIPLKGSFLGSGHYAGRVKVGGTQYGFDLTVELSDSGTRQVTGTISGGGLTADVSIDLAPFNKKATPAPADLVGTFNVILPAGEGADASYPLGTGFGRVTVNEAGKVKFAGRLGDGSSIAFKASLSAQKTWPFFAALYRNAGSISGLITFDTTASENDLSAILDWYKPAGVLVSETNPTGFSGQSLLLGARFAPPLPGERVFLAPSSGVGTLSLDAPADATLPALAEDFLATLDTSNTLAVTAVPTAAAQAITVKIDPATGLFSGSFVESGMERKLSGIIVSPKLNRAAGFFIRGSQSGSVLIAPPSDPN